MTRVLPDSELETFPALEWSEIAGRMSSESRNALDQVLASQDGSVLSREQCLLLANAEGDNLLQFTNYVGHGPRESHAVDLLCREEPSPLPA